MPQTTDGCGEPDIVSATLVLVGEAGDDSVCGAFPVTNGQIIDLECDDKCEVEFDDGRLEIEAQLATLEVQAADSCGNASECVAHLCPSQQGQELPGRWVGRQDA